MNEIKKFARLRPADEVFDSATNERIWAKIRSAPPTTLERFETEHVEPQTLSTRQLIDIGSGTRSPAENPRRRLALLAAALLIGVAGLVILQTSRSTESSVATQPETATLPPVSQPPVTTTPVDGSTVGSNVPDGAVDELVPPKLNLDLDGWQVAAADLDGRFAHYQFQHVDGRQLDVTVEAGGIDVYLDRIATLSADAAEVIDDTAQVADLATIGSYRFDALLEPGSEWVLQVIGDGFANRADFVATVNAIEHAPRAGG